MANESTSGLSPIAIVGMACRFPGAASVEQFWSNLSSGVESVSLFTDRELLDAGVDRDTSMRRDYVRAGAVLEDVEMFAASFFGISPREADVMNPQHRIFLECAWEAVERAGCDPARYHGRIGVFAGAGTNAYLLRNVYGNIGALQAVDPYTITTGNDKDFVPTRVSYLLGLTGPSVAINTACSTSLVAVHMACLSLWSYESDMVLAGGVTIQTPQREGYLYVPGGIRSADGHCRPFDASAQGTTNGSGAGIVVLKRLEDAQADGDVIHAVIRGSAIGNDGADKVGFTAPSVDGQAETIAGAYTLAGVDAATITYVEAHGTATALGDPIEIAALAQAMNRGSRRTRSCAIGSVKSNIGHLDAAAGVAGLIKTALSLEHRELAPSLHFATPNPRIDFAAGPFHVNAQRTPWEADATPRRAGVSSFGIGGTNAHVLVEEAPPPLPRAGESRPFELLPISAKSQTALAAAVTRLGDHLSAHGDLALGDVACTLQLGRKAFEHRAFAVARNVEAAAAALGSGACARTQATDGCRVIFMFPGQGAQHAGMGATLRASEPVFREHVERGLALLDPRRRAEIDRLLSDEPGDAADARLRDTELAQPALFLVEYALAQLWLSWGVQPAAMIGHSVGEFVAACLAGVLSFEDAVRLVAERGRLMQSMPAGAMLAVDLPESELRPLLGDEVSVAAVNAPGRSVASGPVAAIASLAERLEHAGVATRQLETSHAFHSSMMEPAARQFEAFVAICTLNAPDRSILSSKTGRELTVEEATSPAYWGRQLRETVRFADGVSQLLNDRPAVFLELGPGRTLSGFIRAHAARDAQRHVVCESMAHPRQETASERHLMNALGSAWAAGADVDWAAYQRGRDGRRVILPAYPFERTRHWLDAPRDPPRALAPGSSSLTSSPDGLSAPTWRRAALPLVLTAAIEPTMRVVIFRPADGALVPHADALADELGARGCDVTIVTPAATFSRGERSFELDASKRDDYVRLFRALAAEGGLPHRVLHAWAGADETGSFYSLIFVAQALAASDGQWACDVTVMTSGQHQVAGDETLEPGTALTRGPVHVLPQEYPQLRLRSIDVEARTDRRMLLAEIARDTDERDVAIRGRYRWTPTIEPLASQPGGPSPWLREGGVYWITGGFGGVGGHLARHLAERYGAKVALSGRRRPERFDLEAESDRIGSLLRTHQDSFGVLGIDGYDGLREGLERLCTAHIVRTFQRAGIDVRKRQRTSRRALGEALHLIPAFERFLDFFIETLIADRVLQRDGDELVFAVDSAVIGDPGTRAAVLGAAHPGFAPLIDFIGHCALHYLDALSGRVPAIEVLYPGGSSERMERMSRETVEHDDYQAFVHSVRDLAVRLARSSSPLRILEIGGGKGVLTGVVVSAVTGLDVEYHFTDIGGTFVADMERQVAARGIDFVRCGRLDVSTDPEAQGYAAESFDLVIGADVVHATRDVEETLGHVRGLLRPGGILAIIEGSRPRRWMDMIWGLAEGWWLFDDEPRRGGKTPLLGHEAWEGCLARQRFAAAAAFPRDARDRDAADFGLLIAQKADVDRPGTEVLTLEADVADRPAMAAARDRILARFGRIDGVIHAAGVDDRQLAGSYDRVGAASGLRPKVEGVRVLHDVLAGTGVDTLILCSSLSAISAGIGDASYCAANAFLDAYAQACSGGSRRVMSINWDRWRGVGQARPFEARHSRRSSGPLAGGLEPHEALAAFDRLVTHDNLAQVIVSPLAFGETAAAGPSAAESSAAADAGTLHPRPSMSSAYAAPATDIERALAGIFADVLGIDNVGVHDDFSELGGDSLMAVRVVSRVRDLLGRELEVRALFDSPTIAGLATRLEPRQGTTAPVTRGRRDVDAPLSLAQQRLWFLYRLEGPSATYNILAARRLHGRLDRAALQTSVDALVARHETLRTTFDERDGIGHQIVHDPAPVEINEVSLAHLAADARDAELGRVRDAHAVTTFDLQRGPLFAITLVALAPDDHVVLMAMHHIIGDGWSIGVLNDEMARLYAAAIEGRAAPLPPLPIQYRDFAWWQRESLDPETLDAKVAQWRERLAGAPPLLDLHPGRPRPSVLSRNGRTTPVRLSPHITTRLKALARECDASVFMVLLAGFDLLLQRYSGRDDVLVGTQVANRDRRELEGLVGFFINTIVVRTNLAGRPSFRQLVTRVREAALDAFSSQDTPFERLVDALQPERSFSYNPIVQVMLLWQNAPIGTLDLAGLSITPVPMPTLASKFDLTLELAETDGRIEGVIEYSSDLFTAAEIEQMAEQLTRLLDVCGATPDAPIADVPLCDAGAQSMLAAPAAAVDASSSTLVDLFASLVSRQPDAVALVHGDVAVSVAELDRRANQLAHHLIALGVEPESRVGVFMPASIDAIVSILAVLKAGGAYVPLDPGHPAERIAMMRRASGARVVITKNEWRARLPVDAGVVLDRDADRIAAFPSVSPGVPLSDANLAYVLFTSGSTGIPKGVQVEHRNVLTLVAGLRDRVLAGGPDRQRIALMASLVFDASVQQIFMSLCLGHTLCLTDEQTRLDTTALRRFFSEQDIHTSDGTPSLLAILLDARIAADRQLALGHLLIGGEALPGDRVRAFRSQDESHRIALTNIYGPAECCVDVCAHTVSRHETFESGNVPIGTPLASRELHVLDRGGQAQPRGVTGEIFIGGDGIGRGYIGDPAGTARRFLPYAGGHGERGYATGDLGIVDRAGRLQFLGRNDGQVKVRGYRIELGEIEVQLRALAGVRHAAVATRPASTGHMELVAYLVTDRGVDVTTAELREKLARTLPGYMIPGRFVRLDTLPLNSSGKLDRAALPVPDAAAALDGGSRHRAPATDRERDVADVWQAVLHLDRVGADDNYFASGGDSIKALQIVARLRARGHALQIRDFFTHPTVRELATLIGGAASTPASAPGMTRGVMPLTPIQRRFFAEHEGNHGHFCMSVLLASTEACHDAALRRALETVTARHQALRLRFIRRDGEWTQEFSASSPAMAFEIVDLGAEGDPARAMEAHAGAIQASFDLASGPLVKAVLYRRRDGDRLLLAAHHLVVDGVSWRILLEDLEAAYAAIRAGRDVELPAASHSFQAFVSQLMYYAGGAAREERGRWRLPSLAALGEDGPGGVTRYRDLERQTITRGTEETRRLTAAHQAYATRSPELMLAALARAVRDQNGQSHVAVMLEGHGRDLPGGELDLTRTVGWFTSAYPVVIDLAPGDDPGADLKRVKETLRAVPHGGIGYGALRYLTPDGARGISEPPALSFNFLGEFAGGAAGSPFRAAREAIGPSMDPDARPPYELEMVGVIVDGRLELEILYSTRRYRRDTIVTLLDRFGVHFDALLEHALSRRLTELTPSDLDYDGFDLAGLERFFDELVRRSGGAITRDNVQDIRRLTPLQEGLLFHTLADEGSTAYHQQISYRVRGALDAERVRAAWNRLFERHEVLRTAVVHDAVDDPVQVVLKTRGLEMTVEDLRGLTPNEQLARVKACREADRRRGFDLCRDVLMRVVLLRVADDCHEVVWSHHHMLLDGWSLGILQRELQALLDAPPGADATLPYAPNFGDYIGWLGTRDQDASETFWANALAGYDQIAAPPRTCLASPPKGRRRHAFLLSLDSVEALRELASRRGVTVNTVIHALWGLLLARYTGAEDVVFGTAVSGRRPEIRGIEDMVGLFINTVPVRVRPRRRLTFAGLLAQVQADALASEPHHACPLARIQASTPLRDRLLATHVTLENYPIHQAIAGAGGALRIEAAEFFEQTHYDFDMQFLPSADGLRVQASFSESVYDASQVARIEDHLRAAIATVLIDPDVALGDIDLLSEEERRIAGVRPVPAIAAPFATLIDGFERQAAERPDAVAVSSADEQLTYGELDRRATRVARVLRDRGVGPDVLVPLYLDRSLDLVAGILAVMKAGGAYVPMDLSYPAERIAWMLQDCAAPVVLTESARRHELPIASREMLCIDEVGRDDESDPAAPLPRATVHPRNLAYVIYTSGSTGRPKGVMIAHENVTRLFGATSPHFVFGPADVWTMFHSYAFDFSVWEIWGALLYGGRLVVVPFWLSRSPEEFVSLLRDQQVTVLNQTPSAFRLVAAADADGPGGLALRTVIFGGEALDVEHLRVWFGRHGYERPELVNMYGITETTVHVTDRPLGPEVYERRGSLIGRPIPDLDLHVLDGDRRSVPLGVEGELYVGGPGLARGYLKRPALTAVRFGPDPIGPTPGARLYRSGDLGRRLDEREIDYHGRADHQVQLHGFRIELGEIEAALGAHPAVSDAHVEHRQDESGRQELVAYVIAREAAPSTLELREVLESRLPDYMIPAHFVALKAFPLTVNGKLDRRALPAPHTDRAAGPQTFAAPRTDAERVLAGVWREVLHLDRVGVDDNYLALGGDSIKAIQIVSRLRRDGWKLAIRELFHQPTIAALAPSLTRVAASIPAAVTGDAPLTAIQLRFMREHDIEPNRFNQAVIFHAPGGFEVATTRAAIEALVRHHDALRLRIARHGDGWRQHVADRGEPVAFEVMDLPGHRGDEGIASYAARLHGSLDLAKGPLFRAALLRMTDGDRLVMVVHHMAIDGVSWRIVQEDFAIACRQIAAGREIELQRSDAYLAWAAAAAAYAESPALGEELAYWRDVDAHPGERFVRADAPAENRYRDTESERLVLDPSRTASLLRTANAAYRTTPEDLLLATLARALARVRGIARTVVQLEGHGREDVVDGIDVSRTVGWFTSVYPFALVLHDDRDIGYQIKAIKEDLRSVPHRGVGYGLLRYVSAGARSGGVRLEGRPEISFNYLGHFEAAVDAGHGAIRISTSGGGDGVHPDAARPCDLDISALVLGDEASIEFQFAPSRFAAADVARLRQAFDEELTCVLDHCTTMRAPELTPADLTYSALSLDELDELFE
jgi:amino acid adenylation domain-containing protein/non-ribosomal peptide synthase protein (TIGR01720 family)